MAECVTYEGGGISVPEGMETLLDWRLEPDEVGVGESSGDPASDARRNWQLWSADRANLYHDIEALGGNGADVAAVRALMAGDARVGLVERWDGMTCLWAVSRVKSSA